MSTDFAIDRGYLLDDSLYGLFSFHDFDQELVSFKKSLGYIATAIFESFCGFAQLTAGLIGVRAICLILWIAPFLLSGIVTAEGVNLSKNVGFYLLFSLVVAFRSSTYQDAIQVLVAVLALVFFVMSRKVWHLAAFLSVLLIGFSCTLRRLNMSLFAQRNIFLSFVQPLANVMQLAIRMFWLLGFLYHSFLYFAGFRLSLGLYGSSFIFAVPFSTVAIFDVTSYFLYTTATQQLCKTQKD